MVMSRLRSFSQRRDSRVKVAVITGGSRGIGREIAVDFARAGAQTVIVSSVATNLAAASKIITTAGGPTPLAIAADLRTLEGCQQVFNNVKAKFNRCDILVLFSAAATRAGNFVDLPDEAWNGRLRAEIPRLRADVPAVLADAQGRAGLRR
jgi:NAD(P)-dependent dehydrogenase (short-subunit alcohol dehydrogenase family)